MEGFDNSGGAGEKGKPEKGRREVGINGWTGLDIIRLWVIQKGEWVG